MTTLHYYFVLILRVAATADLSDGRLLERGIYTDYVIVFKDTSLGIATVDYTNESV